MALNVVILVYSEVEVLDFAGPFEVFSTACRVAIRDRKAQTAPFAVSMVATAREPVRTRGGLMVLPHQDRKSTRLNSSHT